MVVNYYSSLTYEYLVLDSELSTCFHWVHCWACVHNKSVATCFVDYFVWPELFNELSIIVGDLWYGSSLILHTLACSYGITR